MDGRAPTSTPNEIDAPPPPPDWGSRPVFQPRQKVPKWAYTLMGFLLAIGIAVAVAWPINVPYFALSPGPVNDVTDFISVDDPAEETGDLFFLTVSLREVNLLEYLAALLDDQVDLNPRESIRPAGVTPADLRAQNLALMDISKQNAVFVALTKLGYDVTFEGSGALVSTVIEGSAADGVLFPQDIIVAVDGIPTEFQTDLVDLMVGFGPGDRITLSVLRSAEDAEPESLDIAITLGVFRSVDDDGNISVIESRGMIGVLLIEAPTTVSFPVDVTIDSQNIGGPSAGLMFTLEIINQLSEADITRGHRIAGTGTIDNEGVVGAIGGVRQKVYGAIDAGAEYVFVPAGNFDAAIEAAADDIEVVRVDTIDDALEFLETLTTA